MAITYVGLANRDQVTIGGMTYNLSPTMVEAVGHLKKLI